MIDAPEHPLKKLFSSKGVENMSTLDMVLWNVLPYIVLTIFIGGHIYRYQTDQIGWTTKSSEFLEKRQLRIGSQLFHWGLVFVLMGHILGIIIPEGFYSTLGISEEMYHKVALTFGIPAGVICFLGLMILCWRRLSVERIKKTTSFGDWLSLILIFIVIASGLIATFLNTGQADFDYRTTIGPWFRGIFLFKMNGDLMVSVPLWFKIHILSTFALYVVWPFTRLVHAFSLPVMYLWRNYVIYRRIEKI